MDTENKTTGTNTENSDDSPATAGAASETVTLTEAEVAKRVQSAEDKVRTSYSKKIKELEKQIAELTPQEPTAEEKEIADRVKALEQKQTELDEKEKALKLQTSLSENDLPKSLATYVKGDIDVGKFAKEIDGLVAERIKQTGYQPTAHSNGEGISKEAWKALPYSERVKLYNQNPELFKKYMGSS